MNIRFATFESEPLPALRLSVRSALARSASGARPPAWLQRRVPRAVADKADTFARKRSDQALLFAVVADRRARGVHAAAERRLGNDAPVPDGGEYVVAADHTVPRLNEELQQVEDL